MKTFKRFQHLDNSINLLAALVLLMLVFGCSDDDEGGPTGSRPAASFSIEHWQLLAEYAENEVAADSRYSGKRLQVTGPIDFVQVEHGRIMARFSVPAVSYTQLFAEFPQSQKAAAGSIQRNQRVTLECTCNGMASPGRLELGDCLLK